MYSPYERVKDRRSFVERKDVYGGPLYAAESDEIKPKEKGAANAEAKPPGAAPKANEVVTNSTD